MLTNYLTNRKQRVVLNGFSAEYSPVGSGVPQSVFGLLLFLTQINYFENNIKSGVKSYADDTMLFSTAQEQSRADLNDHLKTI